MYPFVVKMEDEKLIEMVRKYEFLYNLKHSKYMDNNKKEIAWKQIGEQLKQSAVACKQRWQCLRDACRRALNKRKGKTGRAAKNRKKWKYEHEMAFMVPFFVERKTKDSVEITSDDELSDSADENHAIEYIASEKPNTDTKVYDSPADVSDASSTRISEEILHDVSQQQKNREKPKAVKRKAVQTEPSAPAMLMAKMLDDQNKVEPSRGHDELDRFFLSISDTVKKFSPYVQALAKNKIFSLVSEMELQQLAPPSSTPYTFKPSPQSTSTTATPTSPENWNDQTQQLYQ